MVEFKDVYITAKDGKIQWPILDIERITFDETSLTGVQFKEAVQMWMNRAPTKGPVWDNLDAALAEKGAEIARLKEEITRVNNTWYAYHSNLKDQLAELEKLTALQKETIDAQGKQLREARETVLNDVWIKCFNEMNSQSANRILFHYDPEDYIPSLECGEILVILESLGLEDPAQKAPDPELFICPTRGKESEYCKLCESSAPHPHSDSCDDRDCGCPSCIPYKEPSQTPAPEEGKSPIQHLQDRVLEMEQHQGRDRADLMEKIRDLEKSHETIRGSMDFQWQKQKDQIGGLEHRLGLAQDRIGGLEHRLGLAQDRIAEIHPSGCVPPAKSKPKSQLKTDHVKKAK